MDKFDRMLNVSLAVTALAVGMVVVLAQAQAAWGDSHPLAEVVRAVEAGERGVQPAWKLPMLRNGLAVKPVLTARVTAYSWKDPDGGGKRNRWGARIRWGTVAADPRYWGPGSVIWMGPPVNMTLIVEDTGGAIKGPHRFDVCVDADRAFSRWFGYRKVQYVPLHREVPRRRWGTKPADWHPPVWGE